LSVSLATTRRAISSIAASDSRVCDDTADADSSPRSSAGIAEKALARDKLASKDQATREGLLTYLRIASNHFRRQLTDLEGAEEVERVCAAIDAVVRAEGYVESNVNVPLVAQQFVSALERLFSISPSAAGREPG